MKKTLLVVALLGMHISSKASDPGADMEKKLKTACKISAFFIPLAAFAGPQGIAIATTAWTGICKNSVGTDVQQNGSNPVTFYKKNW